MSKNLPEKVKDLAEDIEKFRDRIILEDAYGHKFEIVNVRAIGTNTDDPGVVLKLEVVI